MAETQRRILNVDHLSFFCSTLIHQQIKNPSVGSSEKARQFPEIQSGSRDINQYDKASPLNSAKKRTFRPPSFAAFCLITPTKAIK